jgi:hypothetical protein
MVYRSGTGHSTDVKKDADVGFEDWAKGIEEPAVGVDFLLIFLFQAEDDLDRGRLFLRPDFGRGCDGD